MLTASSGPGWTWPALRACSHLQDREGSPIWHSRGMMSFAQRCCCCSVAQLLSTLSDIMDCDTPGLPVLHRLPEFAQSHIHQVGDVIYPSDPLLPSFPPDFNLSQHQGLSNEYALHIRWPKYWSFSCSISPFNEYSGLISPRIDWFDLPAVQGPLQSLLQHHSLKGDSPLSS